MNATLVSIKDLEKNILILNRLLNGSVLISWFHVDFTLPKLNFKNSKIAFWCRRGFIMGIWNSHTSVGNILGSLIAGVYVSSSWGLSFIVPGIIIASAGVICFLFLVESKSHMLDIWGICLFVHAGCLQRQEQKGNWNKVSTTKFAINST